MNPRACEGYHTHYNRLQAALNRPPGGRRRSGIYGAGSFLDIGIKQAEGSTKVEALGMSEALAEVIRRAIAYERDRRPESPSAFARELRKALGAANNE